MSEHRQSDVSVPAVVATDLVLVQADLTLRPDGLLVCHVESDDLARAQAAMGRTEVNARWQAETAEPHTDSQATSAAFGAADNRHSSRFSAACA